MFFVLLRNYSFFVGFHFHVVLGVFAHSLISCKVECIRKPKAPNVLRLFIIWRLYLISVSLFKLTVEICTFLVMTISLSRLVMWCQYMSKRLENGVLMILLLNLVTDEYGRSFVFGANEPRMLFSVRDPMQNNVYSCNQPYGWARKIVIKWVHWCLMTN